MPAPARPAWERNRRRLVLLFIVYSGRGRKKFASIVSAMGREEFGPAIHACVSMTRAICIAKNIFSEYRYQPWTMREVLHTMTRRNRMCRGNPHVHSDSACGRGTNPAPSFARAARRRRTRASRVPSSAARIQSIFDAGAIRLAWTQDRRGKRRFVRRIRKTLRLENHATAERRMAAPQELAVVELQPRSARHRQREIAVRRGELAGAIRVGVEHPAVVISAGDRELRMRRPAGGFSRRLARKSNVVPSTGAISPVGISPGRTGR